MDNGQLDQFVAQVDITPLDAEGPEGFELLHDDHGSGNFYSAVANFDSNHSNNGQDGEQQMDDNERHESDEGTRSEGNVSNPGQNERQGFTAASGEADANLHVVGESRETGGRDDERLVNGEGSAHGLDDMNHMNEDNSQMEASAGANGGSATVGSSIGTRMQVIPQRKVGQIANAAGVKRGRGRPKRPRTAEELRREAEREATKGTRKRGRPPLHPKPAGASSRFDPNKPKRPRGRPKKVRTPEEEARLARQEALKGTRKRGRPKKLV